MLTLGGHSLRRLVPLSLMVRLCGNITRVPAVLLFKLLFQTVHASVPWTLSSYELCWWGLYLFSVAKKCGWVEGDWFCAKKSLWSYFSSPPQKKKSKKSTDLQKQTQTKTKQTNSSSVEATGCVWYRGWSGVGWGGSVGSPSSKLQMWTPTNNWFSYI